MCYFHAVCSSKNVLSTSHPLLVTIGSNVTELPLICLVCVVTQLDWRHPLYKLVYACAMYCIDRFFLLLLLHSCYHTTITPHGGNMVGLEWQVLYLFFLQKNWTSPTQMRGLNGLSDLSGIVLLQACRIEMAQCRSALWFTLWERKQRKNFPALSCRKQIALTTVSSRPVVRAATAYTFYHLNSNMYFRLT